MNFTPVDELPPKGHGGGAKPNPETVELANYLAGFVRAWVKLDEPTVASYGRSIKERLNKVTPADYEVRYRRADDTEDGKLRYWIFVRRVT